MAEHPHPLSRRRVVAASLAALALPALAAAPALRARAATTGDAGDWKQLSEAEWRERLSDEEFSILREAGTEAPGTSPLLDEKRAGTFVCAGCALPLFSSRTKYDSETGWPSFWDKIGDNVATREDRSLLFLVRTEVLCTRCDGHLGHVFEDGPPPTGLRYCINGLALDFEPGAPASS